MRSCPLGWDCLSMGATQSGNGCLNRGRCTPIAATLHDKEHPNPDIVDALDVNNPYVVWDGFDLWHDSWVVVKGVLLPAGYAVAEPVRLPFVFKDGVTTVVASDREYAPAVPNPNFFLEINSSPIVLIEWLNNGEIRQIFTTETGYWCYKRKDGILLCESSGFPDAIEGDYWLSPFKSKGNNISFYGEPRLVEDLSDRIDQLKADLSNARACEQAFYCTICQDYTYEDSYGSTECNHIHYSDWLGSWGGCGFSEKSWQEDYRVAIGKLNPPDRVRLRKLLEAKNISGLWTWTFVRQFKDELDPVGVWIKSLDTDTPDAIGQTLTWLSEVGT